MSVAGSEYSDVIVHETFDHLNDERRKPPKTECIFRIGPAPREDSVNSAENSAAIGALDSNLETPLANRSSPNQNKKCAGSRALIIYFAKMSNKTNTERVDYRFLESLFLSGADINVTDQHGQTCLHEVVRNWNTDLAKFFLDHRADINKADNLGRTPLHLAAAVNHYEMVEFLITSGANIHAKTIGELQSPIHYAAKYNAVGSLRVLIENRALINDRDYKKRTPLYLAAEMAREESARYLLEIGVPVGVFDDTGMSAIALMIEKMPHIAKEALDQFHISDTAFRKDYYYLNYLENDPKKWREENKTVDENGVRLNRSNTFMRTLRKEKQLACPATALKLAVHMKEFDIIMHPVIQQLIKEKWKAFGRSRAILAAVIHFIYISIWTILGIFLPRDNNYYPPGSEWKIFLELLGVLMTLLFIFKQVAEKKIDIRSRRYFRLWRRRQLNRDLEYCHPQWKQERIYLESEMKANRSSGGGILSDPWNIMDFITYLSVVVVIATRVFHITHIDDHKTDKLANGTLANSTTMAAQTAGTPKPFEEDDLIHLRVYVFTLIFMWLHFMKSCRPFTTLGPFITMLGHVMLDTVTFAFLFFEFFIPYTVGFWILFGGPIHAQMMENAGADSVDWEKFHDLVYSVWCVTLNVDFNFDGLTSVNRLMAQIMVGTFFALSTVLCLNLYIALLSERFNRVYANATANASLLQAVTITQLEHTLSQKKLKEVTDFFQTECGPLVTNPPSGDASISDDEMWSRALRPILGRFDTLFDYLKNKFNITPKKGSGMITRNNSMDNLLLEKDYKEKSELFELYQGLLQHDKELYELQCEVYEIKCLILDNLGKKRPPKPQYKPLPHVNIKPPKKPILAPKKPKMINAPPKYRRTISSTKPDDIFRTILENKAEEYERLDDDLDDISGSWENIPMTDIGDSTEMGDDGQLYAELPDNTLEESFA